MGEPIRPEIDRWWKTPVRFDRGGFAKGPYVSRGPTNTMRSHTARWCSGTTVMTMHSSNESEQRSRHRMLHNRVTSHVHHSVLRGHPLRSASERNVASLHHAMPSTHDELPPSSSSPWVEGGRGKGSFPTFVPMEEGRAGGVVCVRWSVPFTPSSASFSALIRDSALNGTNTAHNKFHNIFLFII